MWELIYEDTVNADVTEINVNLTDTALAILATAINPCDRYYRAGYLSRIIEDANLGILQIEGTLWIPLNKLVVFDFKPLTMPYQLRFELVDWITTMTLEIYRPLDLVFDYSTANNSGSIQEQQFVIGIF
jgi:hypothetical protein